MAHGTLESAPFALAFEFSTGTLTSGAFILPPIVLHDCELRWGLFVVV
jgi:hypothetical protein